MANVCQICGKGTVAGQSRSHSMRGTKRNFKPNIQKKKVTIDPETNLKVEMKLCSKCYKTYRMVA